jgi:alkylation response protein AidB-like acyl-CoA dehydrogenase
MTKHSVDLLEKVREIAPILAEHSAEAERERHLSQPSFEAMRDAGLYRMWIPRDLGGYEVDPVTGMKVLEAVSAIDSAAGWNLQIGCAVTILMAWLPEAGSKEVVETPYCAGGFFPLGRAVAVDGGYRLTARCAFSSGCLQASWFSCQAQVFDGETPRVDGNGEPVVIWPFYKADEGNVVDTWHTMGMRGTGSHDTVAEDVFVPEHRAACLRPLTDPSPAYGGPLYRTTVWVPVAVLAAPALGIAQSAIDFVVTLGKKKPNYVTQTMGERPVAQSQIAEATAMLGASRAFLYEALNEAYAVGQAGNLLGEEQKIKVQLATTYAIRTAADAVDLACRAAGTTAIRETSPLEKNFRDIQVITKHAYSSTARYESVGRLLFGQESDWGFFAL